MQYCGGHWTPENYTWDSAIVHKVAEGHWCSYSVVTAMVQRELRKGREEYRRINEFETAFICLFVYLFGWLVF